jgi:hypothetical protein
VAGPDPVATTIGAGRSGGRRRPDDATPAWPAWRQRGGGGPMTSRGWCGGSGTEEPRSNDVDSGDGGMGQAVEGAGSAPTRDPHARKVKGVGGGDRDARAPTSK